MVLTQPRSEDSNMPSTPLLALDGVVLDTETTGLDARTARLVQIGAIRLGGGSIDEAERFEQLVDPGVPIPAMASAIHGIKDEHVGNAPSFSAIAPELEAFIGQSVVIGHTIAYDLAVLQREYELAGRTWRRPRTLDVRDLAELVQPTLSSYDLERLCAWLSHRDFGPAHGDRRCARHRPGIHDPGAPSAPARHPHPGRSGSRVA